MAKSRDRLDNCLAVQVRLQVMILTFEDTSDPARLHLSLGHNGSEGMDEAHHSQRGVLQGGWEHMLVQANAVTTLVHGIARQEGEVIVVPCGKHNNIHLRTNAQIRAQTDVRVGSLKAIKCQHDSICSHLLQHTVILKHHGRATDLLNVWLDDHRSRQNLEGQVIIEDWNLTKQSIGRWVQKGIHHKCIHHVMTLIFPYESSGLSMPNCSAISQHKLPCVVWP